MKTKMNMRKIIVGMEAVLLCLLIACAAVFLFASNPSKDSEKIIPQSVEKQLNKDTNDITEITIADKVAQKWSWIDFIKWSWIDQDVKKEVTWTAEEAFEDATNYVHGAKPKQLEALKMYQRVLDAKPSRQMELKVRLTMGARMMILYDPSLGEHEMYSEALKWYELLVHDFNDMGNHTDLMTAKIGLGDLYGWRRQNYGIAEANKATALCLEVIKIPENDIIFDNKNEDRYNLDKIQNAKAPGGRGGGSRVSPGLEFVNQSYRQELLEQRQEVINRYRLTAIQSLISNFGQPYEKYLERLISLKKERPDDQLYQKMLDDKIQEVLKTLLNIHSGFPSGLLK
jgi:hypothetical protein